MSQIADSATWRLPSSFGAVAVFYAVGPSPRKLYGQREAGQAIAVLRRCGDRRLKASRPYVTRPIPLGERAWTASPGRLIFGDCFGNHLCYRWRHDGRRYQIDLHAWEPVTRTVQVLHAIVRSTPDRRG